VEKTPASLLEQLRQPDAQSAWERFVLLYTPLLCLYAQRLGAKGQDADDLVQEVFAVLLRRLPQFRYDPAQRFRGWLWAVTSSRFRSLARSRAATVPVTDEVPDDAPGTDDVISEEEYRRHVTRRALELMQSDFEPATRQAFWATAIEGRPAAEVAAELGISENAVYLARGRVLRRLREELAGLLD
jgi:RNA polymerase sigma-70 factor (ECF subfamily)